MVGLFDLRFYSIQPYLSGVVYTLRLEDQGILTFGNRVYFLGRGLVLWPCTAHFQLLLNLFCRMVTTLMMNILSMGEQVI
ncbi:hypothetical protein KUTeg_017977 [Tegillarca granosa]|uniref:Uncharacterized protein n=1 Tax=Tegillarca granosa TaxID=220873 RepID=A0ABQ9EI08_TEGGR|nr:hypothetical protein KUTeg_017977 [Tegillarca granosa]